MKKICKILLCTSIITTSAIASAKEEVLQVSGNESEYNINIITEDIKNNKKDNIKFSITTIKDEMLSYNIEKEEKEISCLKNNENIEFTKPKNKLSIKYNEYFLKEIVYNIVIFDEIKKTNSKYPIYNCRNISVSTFTKLENKTLNIFTSDDLSIKMVISKK